MTHTEEREQFFTALFKKTKHSIELRALPSKRRRFIDNNNYQDIEALIKDKKNENLYFGVCTRENGDGTKNGCRELTALWIDIDKKSLEEVNEMLEEFPYKPTAIVCSGNGYHLYWILKEPMKANELIEGHLKGIAKKLNGDPKATDLSRILRIPGTKNYKNGKTKDVVLLELNEHRYSLSDFDAFFLAPEKSDGNDRSEISIDGLTSKCNFLKICIEKKEILPEPLWYMMVSNVARISPRGVDLVHAFSQGYSGYDRNETDRKILHALNDSSPFTCKKIKESLLDYYNEDCGKNCGVKSPCVLFFEKNKEINVKNLINSLPTLTEIASLDLSVEYMVEGLIPEKGITVFYGKGGRGKTTLMIQIGHAVAEGIPFEELTTKKTPVVYIDFDNPLNVVVEKAKRLGGSDNFRYWHISHELPPSKLDKDSWVIYKNLPQNSLLIFDTLKSSQGLDMNKDETMAFILERFRELRDLGFTIVLLHHTPKSSDTIPKNSTTITDNADHVLGLTTLIVNNERNNDGLLKFGCGEDDKSRYPKSHICLSFDGEVFERVPDPEDVEFENIKRTIVELSKNGPPNQSQIVDSAKNMLGLNRGKVLSLLNRGEGKFWKSSKIKEEKNKKVYELIEVVELSVPIGSNN